MTPRPAIYVVSEGDSEAYYDVLTTLDIYEAVARADASEEDTCAITWYEGARAIGAWHRQPAIPMCICLVRHEAGCPALTPFSERPAPFRWAPSWLWLDDAAESWAPAPGAIVASPIAVGSSRRELLIVAAERIMDLSREVPQ